MAYDENTHFGIMQLYVNYHRWLPFWSSQPPGSEALGPLVSDPSYMFRFLLSFPLRFIELFVHSQTTQVIFLRFLSIIGFTYGVYLFRQLLLKSRASKALVHTVLALFVLTPASPFLAAQINYDNYLLPLTAWTLLLAFKVIDSLKNDKQINVRALLMVASVGFFTCLVMYAYLPVFMAVVLWLGILILLHIRSQGWQKVYKQVHANYLQMPLRIKILVIGFFVLTAGLFMQAYGFNTIKYHTPVPPCDRVMSVDQCMQYAPFRRDFQSHQDLLNGSLKFQHATDPITYTHKDWLRIMSFNLFFALNGEASHFEVGEPFPLPRYLAVFIAIIGGITLLLYQKRLRKNYRLIFMLFVALTYIGVLWQRQYGAFLYNGYAVAVQGRYLLPVLPILYLTVALAIAQLLRRRAQLKAVFAWVAIAILLLQGGGAMVFILRSNDYWYWPNQTVRDVNHGTQKILKPFVIGS